MTIHEFQQGIARYKRQAILPVAVTFLAIAGLGISVTVFKDGLRKCCMQLVGFADDQLIVAATMSLVIVAMFVAFGIVEGAAKKDERLLRPHCQAFLGRHPMGLIVIATGNCTACGKRVIDPPSSVAQDVASTKE